LEDVPKPQCCIVQVCLALKSYHLDIWVFAVASMWRLVSVIPAQTQTKPIIVRLDQQPKVMKTSASQVPEWASNGGKQHDSQCMTAACLTPDGHDEAAAAIDPSRRTASHAQPQHVALPEEQRPDMPCSEANVPMACMHVISAAVLPVGVVKISVEVRVMLISVVFEFALQDLQDVCVCVRVRVRVCVYVCLARACVCVICMSLCRTLPQAAHMALERTLLKCPRCKVMPTPLATKPLSSSCQMEMQ
jgi:hypothetical protein